MVYIGLETSSLKMKMYLSVGSILWMPTCDWGKIYKLDLCYTLKF